MFIFINRRLVRDKIILNSIRDAYRSILPSGTFPVVILFLSIPYEDVDVNVHPAKTEVRFKHQSFIHDAIRDSIAAALIQDKTIVSMESAATRDDPFAPPVPQPRIPDVWISEEPIARRPFALDSVPQTMTGYEVPLGLNFREDASPSAYSEFDRIRNEVRPLGQLRDSFIIATDLSGLILIDQHVAHERVLFENYMRQEL